MNCIKVNFKDSVNACLTKKEVRYLKEQQNLHFILKSMLLDEDVNSVLTDSDQFNFVYDNIADEVIMLHSSMKYGNKRFNKDRKEVPVCYVTKGFFDSDVKTQYSFLAQCILNARSEELL